MLKARELDFCTCRKCQVVGGLLAGGQVARLLHLQEVPGSRLYWEQAARELDFCTCRKCQV